VKTIDCTQGSIEWTAARLGRITASNMEKIISPTGHESKQGDKYMNRLIAEIITGQSEESFAGNAHTERGNEFEQEAADYYAALNDLELQPVGFCLTDDGAIGCSPDRLIGEQGMLEIKTGLGHIFIESALTGC
jgi:YqaJ-like viral recombinase domain